MVMTIGLSAGVALLYRTDEIFGGIGLLTTSSLFFGLSFFTASELLPSNGISSDE
jgi:hypothetical protein